MSGRRRLLPAIGLAAALALAAVLIVKFLFLGPSPAQASFTTLSIISGTVEVQDEGASDFRPAEDGETLDVGDAVRTRPDSRALITFFDGSTMVMEPETNVTMQKLEGEEEGGFFTRVSQSLGVTWHRVVEFADPGSRYETETPAVVVGVRGTLYRSAVEPDHTTTVDVFEGRVAVSAHGIEKIVEAGMRMTVTPDEPLLDPFPLPSPPATLEFELASSALLFVVTPHSTGAGLVLPSPGYLVNQEQATSASPPGEHPQVVLFRRVASGTYEAFMFGVARGPYHLGVVARSNGRVMCESHIQGNMEQGARRIVSIDVKADKEGHILSCVIGEPRLTRREPDAVLVLRDTLLARLPPTPTYVAVLSAPATPTSTLASPTPLEQVLGIVTEPSPTYSPAAPAPPRPAPPILPTPTLAPAPPASCSMPQPTYYGAATSDLSLAWGFETAANEYRATLGLPPLRRDERLVAAAAAHARFVAEYRWQLSARTAEDLHLGPNCSTYYDRAVSYGYPPYGVAVFENVVTGPAGMTAQQAFNYLLSTGHEDPANPIFEDIGTACFVRPGPAPAEFACVQLYGSTNIR